MNLIKDYYDIEALFEIVNKELNTRFNTFDFLEWILNNKLTPLYPYKGFGCIAEIEDDKFKILSYGYGNFYLCDQDVSKDLVECKLYDKNEKSVSALDRFTTIKRVFPNRYENYEENFNFCLDLVSQIPLFENDIFFLTNQVFLQKLQYKYLYNEDQERIVYKKYQLKNELILIKEYFSIEYPSDFLTSEFYEVRKFGLNDMIIPKNQIVKLIQSYKKLPDLKDNKPLHKDDEKEKLLLVIGAILEERKRAARGKRIQSVIAQNIEDMTKNTDAMLSKSTLEKIFSSANKAFKTFNNNDIGK